MKLSKDKTRGYYRFMLNNKIKTVCSTIRHSLSARQEGNIESTKWWPPNGSLSCRKLRISWLREISKSLHYRKTFSRIIRKWSFCKSSSLKKITHYMHLNVEKISFSCKRKSIFSNFKPSTKRLTKLESRINKKYRKYYKTNKRESPNKERSIPNR